MIKSQRQFNWPSKFLCMWVWVGVWETDWTLTHQNQGFFIFFQLYLCCDIINCTVRLVESQADKMNQVIEPCSKVWFANKFLSLRRGFFLKKLHLLRFSGVIEPLNAEWCLVDYCYHSSNRLWCINWWRLTSKAFIHILNVIKTSKKNFKFIKWWPRWFEPWASQGNKYRLQHEWHHFPYDPK